MEGTDMHIEPGVVDAAKMGLATATAAGAIGYTAKLSWQELCSAKAATLALRAGLATIGTFAFFEVLPNFQAGVSEVHFILGTTLFLLLGAAPAAIGLMLGLLLQGLTLAPTDLPMFFVNATTLLVPLFAMTALARRVIPAGTPYVDLRYADVLKLSATYQGGVVAWVAFWVFYGQGVGAESAASVATFAAAYAVVLLVEPIVDLAALAGAKALRGRVPQGLLTPRLHSAA
ncbi:Cobalt uptake substrate-specific transmembrane region [Citreimonas salinaria]|uniref:Cobalt uptake substrate-specific transmembrane region n=2 Tax=Citreimonas salinaria TaxID=321339 RepID=A0A1H3IUN6_9RHOB|nr:Cobalt uptake substrate-specific transmembrane region [Citreimonas salinaria]